MNLSYANLNTKSHYSCGLGIGTTSEIIKAAQENKLHSIALTDQCTAAGLLDFYYKGKELNFPIILGIELFVHHNTELFRFVLLAKNQIGYTNICKLVTASSINKEAYKRPCVSLYDLEDNKEGLYCLSNQLAVTDHLQSIFKDKFFYEVIFESELIETNKKIVELQNFVISSDAYIPTQNFKILQDIMISNTAYGYSKEPMKTAKPILSIREIVDHIIREHKYLDADKIKNGLANTIMIADDCKNIELKFKDQIVNYPHLLHPLNHDSVSKEDLIRRIIKDNGRMKYDDPIYLERLEYELQTIQNNGRVNLIDYFLVLEDICRWCRENDIPVGPGRGSGAGSLVNYCLKVTHIDPIKYGLLFERFISAGRIQKGTLPDVDLDFAEQEPVRQHIIEMFGEDRVIPIGTMQTLKARGAIKDIFRAFHPELDFQYVQAICNALGQKDQEETEAEYFERGLETSEVIQKGFKEYPDVEQYVRRLLGYNRQPGIHPCGVAICQDSLKDFLPLRFDKEKWVIEFGANDCEKAGVIKYDILGLKTLKFMQTCLKLTGIEDLYSIPLDDVATFKAFVAGDTASVFQFNSDVAKHILMQLPLDKMSLDTLSMVTSVGRPGPMKNNQHNEFIKRVIGARGCNPPHQALYETLKDTYGIMIYQESVMKASEILGGFTLAEADDIRKAMGKKKASVLAPYKSRFVDYCKANFLDTQERYEEDGRIFESKAEYIWELMATFSGYGFNKSHSMSYALIGYYCQYLKVHYPVQWWTACMTHADSDQLRLYYQECSMMTINPDINRATSEFFITEENKIQMPFTCIKGLGPKAAEEIATKRPYTSFADFFDKVNKTKVNKGVVEKLIFCGCFDSFNTNTQYLIDEYYMLRGDEKKKPEDLKVLTNSKVQEMRAKGLSFLSMDYYKIYPHFFIEAEMIYFANLVKTSLKVTVGGIVQKVNMKKTKTQKDYCDIIIANDGEDQSIRVWSDELEVFKKSLEVGTIIKVTCNTSEYNGKLQLTATNITSLVKE
jgi:DNA polymerase III subunit alpha